MTNSVALPFQRQIAVQRMPENNESAVVFEYRGQLIEVRFLPDEDGAKATDQDNEFSSTPRQIKAWERGEWWFFHVLVRALDPESREPLEADGFDFGRSYGRLPSRLNHSDLIYGLCDEVCDTIEEARALALVADAEWLGYSAFTAGVLIDCVPPSISSSQELAGAWQSGWSTASELQKIEALPHGQNGSGSPCIDSD